MSAPGLMRATALGCLLLGGAALAQGQDEKVEGGLEAVQERGYRLNFEINVGAGIAPLDVYTKSYFPTAGVVVHFTDTIAWQVLRAGYCFNVNSSLRDQLERDFDQLPTAFNEVQLFAGSDLIFTPFYGKSTVLNRFVLNYEAYFVFGVSVYKFSQRRTLPRFIPDAPGFNFGGGLRLFHTKTFSYRVDVTNTFGTTFKGVYNVLTVQALIGLNLGGTE